MHRVREEVFNNGELIQTMPSSLLKCQMRYEIKVYLSPIGVYKPKDVIQWLN